jgi:hypothetical protein
MDHGQIACRVYALQNSAPGTVFLIQISYTTVLRQLRNTETKKYMSTARSSLGRRTTTRAQADMLLFVSKTSWCCFRKRYFLQRGVMLSVSLISATAYRQRTTRRMKRQVRAFTVKISHWSGVRSTARKLHATGVLARIAQRTVSKASTRELCHQAHTVLPGTSFSFAFRALMPIYFIELREHLPT